MSQRKGFGCELFSRSALATERERGSARETRGIGVLVDGNLATAFVLGVGESAAPEQAREDDVERPLADV